MGIKTNELQQLSSILGTDSLLADTAAAGTGRLSAAALAQFMDQELLKPGTGLSTQLGNKQPRRESLGGAAQVIDGTDLNDIHTNGWYQWTTAQNQPFAWGYMLVISTQAFETARTQIAWSYTTEQMCRRTLIGGEWTPWTDFSMAQPLELAPFPYADGITKDKGYGQHYWRQGRTVYLSVMAYLPACQASQWLLIGTLPEGYRPEKTINDIAAIFRPDSVAAVEISSATGEVRVWPHVDIPNSGTSSYDKPYCFISTCFAVSQ